MPRPEELHPPLREALKKDMELSLSLAPLTARAAVLRALERDNMSAGNNPVDDNRIRALTGEPLLQTATEKSELEEVLVSIQDRKNARNRLAGIIEKERAIASRLVCDAVRSEHAKLVKAVANDALTLHTSYFNYLNFVDEVQDAGAAITSLNVVMPTLLGSPKDLSGFFFYTLKEFVDAGFLKEMPKALT